MFLAKHYRDKEFDSPTVAKDLAAEFPYLAVKGRVSPKLVSNDLRRLYMMGFLRRRKVKRECWNRQGKRYNCGYKYMYQINNQGWRYIEFLRKSMEAKKNYDISRELIKELPHEAKAARLGFEKRLAVKLLENKQLLKAKEILKNVNEEIDNQFHSKGYRRFKLSRILFEERVNYWIGITELLQEIMNLKKELEAKEILIEALRRELEKCQQGRTSR